jgi:hypothetical protein
MPSSSDTPGCLATIAAFALVATPVYLVMRFLVGLVRQAYGFDGAGDQGPPLRICSSCHNTVLESDYTHCPYCGAVLAAPQ